MQKLRPSSLTSTAVDSRQSSSRLPSQVDDRCVESRHGRFGRPQTERMLQDSARKSTTRDRFRGCSSEIYEPICITYGDG